MILNSFWFLVMILRSFCRRLGEAREYIEHVNVNCAAQATLHLRLKPLRSLSNFVAPWHFTSCFEKQRIFRYIVAFRNMIDPEPLFWIDFSSKNARKNPATSYQIDRK